jgi:hypothetical protein
LNDFGELYRDRGYRVRAGNEGVVERPLSNFPVAFRTTLAYQLTSTTNQPTDAGDRTVTTGGFAPPEADLIFGINLAPMFSAFAVATGFGDDGTVTLESAWGRINGVGGSSWLNFKIGRLELDLPRSEHRSYTLTTPFLIYHYHPIGSQNGFSIGDNQLGIELMGHGDGPGLRYALSLLSASGSPGSDSPLTAPTLYGHLTYTALPDSDLFQRLRVGVLGTVGWWPTSFATLTPMGGEAAPVAGTGTDHKAYWLLGGELHLTLTALARPLTLSIAYLYGAEDAALVENGTQSARYHGGFVEADYSPSLAVTLFARGDAVWNAQQADPTQPSSSNDQTGLTAGMRYFLWLSPWGSIAGHFEVGTVNTENAAATPTNPVRVTTVLAGLDLAI